MSTWIVGPSRTSKSAALSPARPDLKPAGVERMRWPKDHAAGQLDRPRADLADQVRSFVEILDRHRRGRFEVRKGADKLAMTEPNPLMHMPGFELRFHPIES